MIRRAATDHVAQLALNRIGSFLIACLHAMKELVDEPTNESGILGRSICAHPRRVV